MPIVEELRMEVSGPDCGFMSARRSARSFCNGCRTNATILQDRALSQIAMRGAKSIPKQKQHKADTISFDLEHQNGILGFMAFSRSHTYGVLAVAISKLTSSYFCRG